MRAGLMTGGSDCNGKAFGEEYMEVINLNVQGMSCGACSGRLVKVLEKKDAVDSAEASHEDNSCRITFDPEKISRDELVEIVNGTGFTVEE